MSEHSTICVLGGSFDPIHIGHLVLAARAREALGVEQVLLMPTARSPHKGDAGADDDARLEMLRAAVDGHDWLHISELEIRRGAPSFTIDTVMDLKRLHPKSEIVWVIGADQWASLATWHRAVELASLCRFAVAMRPGSPRPDHSAMAAIIDMPQLDISSSDIRSRISRGLSVDWLVPQPVVSIIRSRELYGFKQAVL